MRWTAAGLGFGVCVEYCVRLVSDLKPFVLLSACHGHGLFTFAPRRCEHPLCSQVHVAAM